MSCYLKDEAERTIQLEARIHSLEAERDAALTKCKALEKGELEWEVLISSERFANQQLDAAIKRAEAAEKQSADLKQNLEVEIGTAVETGRAYEQLESALRDRDAQCAAMRKALREAWNHLVEGTTICSVIGYCEVCDAEFEGTDRFCHRCVAGYLKTSIASDAGKPLLEYIERLEAALKPFAHIARTTQSKDIGKWADVLYVDCIHASDALRSKP